VSNADKSLAAVHARRVIFIDLARALAVVFMLYGHAVDALLAPVYRSGRLYEAWLFQRGLTSCLFLLLSGFAFSIATARHWAAQLTLSPALLKRARRFGLFILLGYALHMPASSLRDLVTASDAQWRALLAVDVLQLIGATFVGVQLLVMITRSRGRFTAATLALAAIVAAATPFLWSLDWTAALPLWLASYCSPVTGSQFPLFPWAAYILVGAGLGQIYSHWGAARLSTYANVALLLPGSALLGFWFALEHGPVALFGSGPFSFVPGTVCLRAGACLIIVGVMAHTSRHMARLPHVFGAVAQETLLIYFVHLCIVYGSVWNTGLAAMYGMALAPQQMLLLVVLLIAAMTLLAWYWNWWKHTQPRAARWMSVAAGAVLFFRLI
jgi:uncharacterized membrane protein